MNRIANKGLLLLLTALLLFPVFFPAPAATADEVVEDVLLDEEDVAEETAEEAPSTGVENGESSVPTARDAFIDDIIASGEKLFKKARGKAQRAHYKSDIYICKNFTVYLFRQNRDKYRMAEYPDVKLVIPDNLPVKDCKPYYYGILWKDVPASEGNPFYIAAEFRYDKSLSYDENLELAMDFMREVRRGD